MDVFLHLFASFCKKCSCFEQVFETRIPSTSSGQVTQINTVFCLATYKELEVKKQNPLPLNDEL
jgi:hypothetical protein